MASAAHFLYRKRTDEYEKMIAMLLVFAMVLPLWGCGKSKAVANVEELISAIGEVSLGSSAPISSAQNAYNALTDKEKAEVGNYNQLIEAENQAQYIYAKDAYDNLRKAFEIANAINGDLYDITEIACRDDNGEILKRRGIEFIIAEKTLLSEDDLIEGYAITIYQAATDKYVDGSDEAIEEKWMQLDESDREYYRGVVRDKSAFSQVNPLMRYAGCGLVRSYIHNQTIVNEASACLRNAKETLKIFTANYSDYEYYPNLKGLYTAVNSLLELGTQTYIDRSFDQYTVTLNNYRKEIEDYQSDLDFIFAD